MHGVRGPETVYNCNTIKPSPQQHELLTLASPHNSVAAGGQAQPLCGGHADEPRLFPLPLRLHNHDRGCCCCLKRCS